MILNQLWSFGEGCCFSRDEWLLTKRTFMTIYDFSIYQILLLTLGRHWIISDHFEVGACDQIFTTRGQPKAVVLCSLAALQGINASPCWITLPCLIICFAFSSIIHRGNTPVTQRSGHTSISRLGMYETGFPHLHYAAQTDTCFLFGWCSPICLFF